MSLSTLVRSGLLILLLVFTESTFANPKDFLREFQFRAAELDKADWIHWGVRNDSFSGWNNHSNRLIPVYSFGIELESVKSENSCYRDPSKLVQIYGQLPLLTHNPNAEYFDQTDIARLLRNAWENGGKKHVILVVFDGMDWQTTQAAATYKQNNIKYVAGRGTGLRFLDYDGCVTDFGFCVTSPHNGVTKFDVDGQILTVKGGEHGGGYSWENGGSFPWSQPKSPKYLLGKLRSVPHPYTDSAASATALNSGKKTYNGSINIGPDGKQLETIAHIMQREKASIGVVSSVAISHATPACVYSHNVSRNDYQDLTRDLIGLRSIAHRAKPLQGVDVLIGCGWGEFSNDLKDRQGSNYLPGNPYITEFDLDAISSVNDGNYVVAQRTSGRSGSLVLDEAAEQAVSSTKRLFGFFGVDNGHLPYRTADGAYNPTRGSSGADLYTDSDISENPTLADMTSAALKVLSRNENGFFLMVESGDVDWANHNNNIDDSIGAVFSGDDAFVAIVDWVRQYSNWNETAVIVTADHAHFMFLDDPEVLTGNRPLPERESFEKLRAIKYNTQGFSPASDLLP